MCNVEKQGSWFFVEIDNVEKSTKKKTTFERVTNLLCITLFPILPANVPRSYNTQNILHSACR